VVPGLIFFALHPEILASGNLEIIRPEADRTYINMIRDLVPAGLKGVLLAALFGAIQSTVSAVVNSTSTVVTLDLYKRFVRPDLSEEGSVRLGKWVTGVTLVIAILSTDGVEQSELTEPRDALEKAGAKTDLVSPVAGKIQAMQHQEKGDKFDVDVELKSANPDDYDALLLPGGVANPDALRIIPEAVKFVRSFFDSRKPIASICHGPWMLVEADIAQDHTMTSWPSLRTDIRNAGGNWVDEEVVQDGQITTSRQPEDIPAFVREMLKSFAENSQPE